MCCCVNVKRYSFVVNIIYDFYGRRRMRKQKMKYSENPYTISTDFETNLWLNTRIKMPLD